MEVYYVFRLPRILFLVIVGSISSLGHSDAFHGAVAPSSLCHVKDHTAEQTRLDFSIFFLYQDLGCDVNCSLVHLSHDQIILMQF